MHVLLYLLVSACTFGMIVQRFSRAGPRGRGREWATLGVHPLSWLLSNNRLEKVPVVRVSHTSSNRLLLSNQDKGCTPSVAHSLPLPLGPALLNLSSYSGILLWHIHQMLLMYWVAESLTWLIHQQRWCLFRVSHFRLRYISKVDFWQKCTLSVVTQRCRNWLVFILKELIKGGV